MKKLPRRYLGLEKLPAPLLTTEKFESKNVRSCRLPNELSFDETTAQIANSNPVIQRFWQKVSKYDFAMKKNPLLLYIKTPDDALKILRHIFPVNFIFSYFVNLGGYGTCLNFVSESCGFHLIIHYNSALPFPASLHDIPTKGISRIWFGEFSNSSFIPFIHFNIDRNSSLSFDNFNFNSIPDIQRQFDLPRVNYIPEIYSTPFNLFHSDKPIDHEEISRIATERLPQADFTRAKLIITTNKTVYTVIHGANSFSSRVVDDSLVSITGDFPSICRYPIFMTDGDSVYIDLPGRNSNSKKTASDKFFSVGEFVTSLDLQLNIDYEHVDQILNPEPIIEINEDQSAMNTVKSVLFVTLAAVYDQVAELPTLEGNHILIEDDGSNDDFEIDDTPLDAPDRDWELDDDC